MELACVVHTGTGVDEEGDSPIHKYYFDLRFPYLRIERKILKEITGLFITNLQKDKVRRRILDEDPIGEWSECLDFRLEGTYPMIGSSQNGTAYTFDQIYGELDIPSIEDEEPQWKPVEECFLIDQHQHSSKGWLDKALVESIEEKLDEGDSEQLLPMLCSTYYGSRIAIFERKKTMPVVRSSGRRKPRGKRDRDDVDEDAFEMAVHFLSMFSPQRYNQRMYWVDIGRALYHISLNLRGPEAGLETWIKFTQKYSREFTPDDCREEYPEFESEDRPLSVKTLAWYAMKDNNIQYTEWHRRWCRRAVETSLSLRETDLAESFYRNYWLDYLCEYHGRVSTWYYFNGHTWKKTANSHKIMLKLMTGFEGVYNRLRIELSRDVDREQDPSLKTLLNKQIDDISKVLKKIGGKTALNNLVSLVGHKFHDENFSTHRDLEPSLLGCKNGVLEMIGNESLFRPGKPEDYITKSTHRDFRKYGEQDKYYVMLLDWFKKIYPDPQLYHETLKLMSSWLYGRNTSKVSPLHIGDGDNAKSTLKIMISNAFGDYCFTFEPDIFTQSRKGSRGPSPELAAASGSRVIFVEEFDDDEKIKGGFWKKLTGGDDFFARFLQENGGLVKVTFMINFMCNKPPVVENPDKAARARIMIIPYLSIFSDDAPDDPKEQIAQRKFKNDRDFHLKLKHLAGPFMYLLTQYYPIYRKEKLGVPEVVKKYTEKYWHDSNSYTKFTRECVEVVYKVDPKTQKPIKDRKGNPILDDSLVLHCRDVHAKYLEWLREYEPSSKNNRPDRGSVKRHLEQCWKEKADDRDRWYGRRLVEEDE